MVKAIHSWKLISKSPKGRQKIRWEDGVEKDILTHSTVQSPSWEANWFAAIQEISRIYRTRRFITALTSVRHLSLSWASPNQSIYPHHTSWRSILMLSTHLRLGLPSGSFPPVSPPRPYTPPLHTHTHHMPSPSHSSRFYHPHDIGWAVQIIYLLVMQSPPFPRYLVPPRSKYSSQHHVLKHPQLPFLPQCQRPLHSH